MKMRKSERRYYYMKLGFSIASIGSLMFFMLEVVFGQVILDWMNSFGENSYAIVLIVNIGFIGSIVIGMVVSALTSEQIIEKRKYYGSIFVAYSLNFFIIVAIAYSYSGEILLPNTMENFTDNLVLMPKVLVYFGGVVLPNPTLLWLIANLTYSVVFTIVVILVDPKIRKINKRLTGI